MKTGDKVIDKSNSLNNGLPMTLTKIEGTVATVEYFNSKEEGKHEKVEIDINLLDKLQ